MTLLCVPIFVESVEGAKRDISAAIEAGADLIELRLDNLHLSNASEVRRLIFDSPREFILTCRAPSEGGRSELPDDARIQLLAEVAPTDQSIMIDVELATIRNTGTDKLLNDLVISIHDFMGRPDRLYNLSDELNRS